MLGQGVGEHRDPGDDHHEGEAHHREDPAPVGVLGRGAADDGGDGWAQCGRLGAHGALLGSDRGGVRSGGMLTDTDGASG